MIKLNFFTRILAALFFLFFNSANGQGNWTWMNGTTAQFQPPVYDTIGAPSATNTPGDLSLEESWTGNDGKFWLFGGFNVSSTQLANLWRYDPSTNEWTWIQGPGTSAQAPVYGTVGVASSTVTPGSRLMAATWTDLNGNLWLYGGSNFFGGSYHDLWKYDISANQWAWISGPSGNSSGAYGTLGVAAASNVPGALYSTTNWVDLNGDLWMFGGVGDAPSSASGTLDELWKYSISSNLWTWINGSTAPGQAGVYGVKGTASAGNRPPSRSGAVGWTSTSGELYLFGGNSNTDYFNDLWKFTISSGEWTWINGSSSSNQPGVYGVQTTPSPSNIPAPRASSYAWKHNDGSLWLFGGDRLGAAVSPGALNDLWKYDVITGNWTWMKGSDTLNQAGIYGNKGVSAPANTPGARTSGAFWKSSSGDFWLFGGATSSFIDSRSDVWRFADCTVNCTTVGIKEEAEDEVEIYPNPASAFITVKNAFSASRIEYRLFDIQGYLVKSGELKSQTTSVINITELKSGLYFLQVYKNGNYNLTKKVMVN